MKLIRQKHKSDCGVASLAMLLNITWEKAVKILFPNRKRGGHYTTKIEMFGEALLKKGFDISIYFNTNTKIQSIKLNSLLIIQEKKNYFHAIVWDAKNKLILDPGFKKPINLKTDKIQLNGRKLNANKYYNRVLFCIVETKKKC